MKTTLEGDCLEKLKTLKKEHGTELENNLKALFQRIFPQAEGSNPHMVNTRLEGLLHPNSQDPIKIGIVAANTRNYGSDTGAIESCILEASSSGRYHIVVAPEYSFLPKGGPLPEDKKDEYAETFRKASKNGIMIIPGTFVWQQERRMFNTAYVFYNGEVIFNYDKNFDGGEAEIAKKHNLVPNYGTSLGLFNWGSLKLGIEICADNGILSERGVRDRDLVFLVSAGSSGFYRSMKSVKKNGYGVVADGVNRAYASRQQTE